MRLGLGDDLTHIQRAGTKRPLAFSQVTAGRGMSVEAAKTVLVGGPVLAAGSVRTTAPVDAQANATSASTGRIPNLERFPNPFTVRHPDPSASLRGAAHPSTSCPLRENTGTPLRLRPEPVEGVLAPRSRRMP